MSGLYMYAVVIREIWDRLAEKDQLGKMMAQAGHAFVHALEESRLKDPERVKSYLADPKHAKIILAAPTLIEFSKLCDELGEAKLPHHVVTDFGLTVFAGPTITCLGVGPILREERTRLLKRFRIL